MTKLRNVPPDQTDILAGNYEELLQRKNELLKAADRAPKVCDDDETAKKLTDFVGQMGVCISRAKEGHRIEKEPFLRGGQNVDEFFRNIRTPLEAHKTLLEKLLGGWQQRKQEAERKAALEAERLAREEMERLMMAAETEADLEDAIAQEDAALEQAAIAAARPLERSRIRADWATGSLITSYEYEIVDLTRIPRQFWIVSEAAIKQHIAARPRDGAPEPVSGLRFIPVHKARIRA
jgi:hypothetical protein